MRRIIGSLVVIAGVAALGVLGTRAFFSDTETSNGNILVAGSLDLKIDSTAHYDGLVCKDGKWVDETPNDNDDDIRPELEGTDCDGTWPEGDLTNEKFYNLSDIKPGDFGENTISMHVIDNDAWACIDLTNLHNDDLGLTEPESAVDDTDGLGNGELAQSLYFWAWNDSNGNNIWDTDEVPYFGSPQTAGTVLGGTRLALADSTTGSGPLSGGDINYIGLAWCAGTFGPLTAGSPITCNGSSLGNEIQTDSLTGDVSFYVVQARNNSQFTCGSLQQ